MHTGLRAFGASLAIAGAVTVGTIHTAGAAQPVNLSAILRTVDRAVTTDATANYGLPVTSASCWGTGPGTVACILYGPDRFRAIGDGNAYPNAYMPGGIWVAMVYR